MKELLQEAETAITRLQARVAELEKLAKKMLRVLGEDNDGSCWFCSYPEKSHDDDCEYARAVLTKGETDQ